MLKIWRNRSHPFSLAEASLSQTYMVVIAIYLVKLLHLFPSPLVKECWPFYLLSRTHIFSFPQSFMSIPSIDWWSSFYSLHPGKYIDWMLVLDVKVHTFVFVIEKSITWWLDTIIEMLVHKLHGHGRRGSSNAIFPKNHFLSGLPIDQCNTCLNDCPKLGVKICKWW